MQFQLNNNDNSVLIQGQQRFRFNSRTTKIKGQENTNDGIGSSQSQL